MSESQKLLHEHPDDTDSEPEQEHTPSPPHQLSPSPASSRPSSASPAPPGSRPNGHPKRVSSFAQPRPHGTPRTPNRVRFDDDPVRRSMNWGARGAEWIELEGDDYIEEDGLGTERVQRLPLLTGIEAPSVTVAEEAFDPEEHLENAKPRSGTWSAFMNMANSIMWVGPNTAQWCWRSGNKKADKSQRRGHHRPALRIPQRRPHYGHRPPRRPHNHSGLDHPAHCDQFEAQRHRLVPGDGRTLFWEVGPGRYLASTMAIVRAGPLDTVKGC